MKKLLYLFSSLLFIGLIWACNKEESPEVEDFQVYVNTSGKNFAKLETSPYTCDSSKEMRFLVKTRNDVAYYVTVWPGQRTLPIMKSKLNASADSSINVAGVSKPVYTNSNNYEDYGVPKASGLAATRTDSGYVVNYTYTRKGAFKLTMVISNGQMEDTKVKTKSIEVIVK